MIKEEDKDQIVGTHDDYFDMKSDVINSDIDSHYESLHHSPANIIVAPDYFN